LAKSISSLGEVDMHKMKELVKDAIHVLEADLEMNLRIAHNHGTRVPHGVIHNIREDLDALEDAACIQDRMGWQDHASHNNPY